MDQVEEGSICIRAVFQPHSTMIRSKSLAALLLAPLLAAAGPNDSFHESLTLHPLPDGKLSVSFEFTTYFDSPAVGTSLGGS